MATEPRSRRAGVLAPLFSIPSSRSWGVGDIGDIGVMTRWLERAGLRLLQLLPINEMPPHETSPYSALSAMAIDPQFIAVGLLEDFAALGGEPRLEADLRARIERVRAAPAVDYAGVRALKQTVLRRSFARFLDSEWAGKTGHTGRAAALRAYMNEQAWWLDEYALFRALHASEDERPWPDWPAPLRNRDPAALAQARLDLADDILYRQYLQWVANDQWDGARTAAGGVALFGDLPFMVSVDSADVWARQDEFRLDVSAGVPPDAFSEDGQDWRLPAYRWDVVAAGNFGWLRDRARRNADLFDGYRVDHLVGFYRTYFRPHDGSEPQFTPADEAAQTRLGARVLQVLREPGAEIIAEDLGIVPEFVRESLTRLSVPGYRVLRWERQWDADDQPFTDPVDYPPRAVATSGTHDTESMAVWWEGAPTEEKAAVLAIPSVRARLTSDACARATREPGLSDQLRDTLLEVLYASGGDTLILPIQDVFGWRDRINQPATVSAANWTWRLPWPVDQMSAEPEAVAAALRLREWARRYGR
ncbi:MAG: 4-alpha-glucanotransferase [Acidobacteria bacterium]|nr:4-alpha-glucanotransferase [Acidobacteriota bacterium]